MAFPLTLSLTGALSSSRRCGKPSVKPWGPWPACPQGTTLKQMGSLREPTRFWGLHFAAWWSTLLPWIEYAHNSLPSSSTCRSPFEVSLAYQPPLFPSHEQDISVPSVQGFMDPLRPPDSSMIIQPMLCEIAWREAHGPGVAVPGGFGGVWSWGALPSSPLLPSGQHIDHWFLPGTPYKPRLSPGVSRWGGGTVRIQFTSAPCVHVHVPFCVFFLQPCHLPSLSLSSPSLAISCNLLHSPVFLVSFCLFL